MATPLSHSHGLVIQSAPSTTPSLVAPHRRPVLPGPHRTLPSVAVVIGYFLIGAAAFWPVFPISGRPLGAEADGDFTLALWLIAWVPHALAHGLNPLFSNAMYVPTGINLSQNTASP